MAVHDAKPPPSRRGLDDPNPGTAVLILRKTQYLYALLLLAVFLVGAAWLSLYNAKKDHELAQPLVKGPGGNALPVTKSRKRADGSSKLGPSFGRAAKIVFRYLAAIVLLCYIATGLSLFIHAFWYEDPYWWSKYGLPWADESTIVHVVGSTFYYLFILLSLFDWRNGPNIVHLTVWLLAIVGEILLASTTYLTATRCHLVSPAGPRAVILQAADGCINSWTRFDLLLYFIRLLHLFLLVSLFSIAWACGLRRPSCNRLEEGHPSESVPLLTGPSSPSYQTNGGRQDEEVPDPMVHSSDVTPDNTHKPETAKASACPAASDSAAPSAGGETRRKDDQAAFYRPQKLPHRTWWEYLRGYSLFFPYLWPRNSLMLQLHVMTCFGIVILQRLINVAVPYQIGRVVNKLEAAILAARRGEPLSAANFPFADFGLLGFLWLLQGQSGILGSLRSLLWVPVSQYSYRGLTTAAFNHVHSLSLDFHLSKRTGEVLSALNKGSAINQFLEQVTFQVVPMLIDLFLSISVFYYEYGPLYAEINLVDTCWYLYMTIKMASTRADQRREMTNADREEEAVKNDSISSYETVKYFNAEQYESNRYQQRVAAFQMAEAKVQMGMVMMNICQAIVFNFGRIIAALVCGWQVAVGMRTTGDWFTVVSYLTQLQGPLNFFGTFYRTVQQAMISGERLLELFKIQPTVVDAPHAKPLKDFRGHIRWTGVSFSYDRRKSALRDVSFECEPGTTTAFVGESGGGKSTLFRHMFRYYDCDEGSIELDGQNVKDLTINSVRSQIGVVPQDTTLFNESVMYNLKYANPEATDEQVYEACKAARVHDRIMTFPDKYESQVGERGLRLSGGEKQRVAIARTLLKDPRIIMLDEATSALDTQTEQEIQDNAWRIGEGRTLLVIAHRLSTIINADQIIVLHAGSVVEKGTHEELMELDGRYALLWKKQSQAEGGFLRGKGKSAVMDATSSRAAAREDCAQGVECNTLGSSDTFSVDDAGRRNGRPDCSSSTSPSAATNGSSPSSSASAAWLDGEAERRHLDGRAPTGPMAVEG